MAIAKLNGKPTQEGVFFFEGKGWGVVVVEKFPVSGELFCSVWGDPEDWPEGTYYGPVDIEHIKHGAGY